MQQQRTLVTTIIYTVLSSLGVIALFLAYGLMFQHDATVHTLLSAMWIAIVVIIFVSICILAPKMLNFMHDRRMKVEEYKRSRLERVKIHAETGLLQMDAQIKQAELELKQQEKLAKTFDIVASQKRLAMEIEAMRIHLHMEQQQSSIIRVPLSESIYTLNGNEFTQLVQGQQIARIQQVQQKQIAQPQDIPMLPRAPEFADVRRVIEKSGVLMLGWNNDGPIYGDVTDLLSMAIVGKPGTGKSSALLYYLAMLILVNTNVWVFDPQGSLSELAGLVNYVDNMEDISNAIPTIMREMQVRDQMWRAGQRKQVKGNWYVDKEPLLILVDELPAIADYERENKPEHSLLKLSRHAVLEWRKYMCFCMLTAQVLPADVLPTATRDSLASRIVFNMSDSHSRIAGLDEDSRKVLLPLIKRSKPGTMILDVSRRNEPEIASIPYTTMGDIAQIIGSRVVESDSATDTPAYEAAPVRNMLHLVPQPERVSLDDKVLKMYNEDGMSYRDIADELGVKLNQVQSAAERLKERGLLNVRHRNTVNE